MWLIFGILTIGATFYNLSRFKSGKDTKFAMAMGLSFTSLTLCSERNLVTGWVIAEDWGALSDVVPYTQPSIWIFTFLFIALNVSPILIEKIHKK